MVRHRSVDGPSPHHPATSRWLMDSPTRTQAASETQLTEVSTWGEETVAALLHGWPSAPVRIERPASEASPTALPTPTQVFTAVHETPMSAAEVGLTDWETQVAPRWSW